MKVIIALLALVALVFGQYNPNSFVMQDLTPGVTSTGAIFYSQTNYYYSIPYRLWIPSNATSFNITIQNLNYTACSYIAFYVRTGGAACNPSSYDDDSFYCANSDYDYTPASSPYIETVEMYPGYYSGSYLVEWKTNDYFYITITQDTSGNDEPCAYGITAQVEANCAPNTIGITAGLSTSTDALACSTYTTVPNTGSTSYNISNTMGTGYFSLYAMDVQMKTGMIKVTAVISDNNADIYGNQYSAYGDSGTYKCYDNGGSSNGNGYYTYELDCYVPRTGLFVFSVSNDNTFNGTISFAVTTCPAGMGGYNCSFPEMAFNYSAFPLTVTVPANPGEWLSYNQALYYVDVPANFTGADAIIFVTSPQSTYLQVRIDGYPEYYSPYGYEDSDEGQSVGTTTPAVWGLTNFDYVHPGRYYFSFMCRETTTACVFTVALNNSVTPSSSGGSTTAPAMTTGPASGSTTAMMSTTSVMSTTAMMSTTSRVSTTTPVSSTTANVGVTTAAEGSGFEYLIPSVVLLLVALLF